MVKRYLYPAPGILFAESAKGSANAKILNLEV